MLTLIARIQDDVLTFREVLSDIPHDAAAIFVYVLVALFIAFIWRGSRSRASHSDRDSTTDKVRDGDEQGLR